MTKYASIFYICSVLIARIIFLQLAVVINMAASSLTTGYNRAEAVVLTNATRLCHQQSSLNTIDQLRLTHQRPNFAQKLPLLYLLLSRLFMFTTRRLCIYGVRNMVAGRRAYASKTYRSPRL